MAQAVTNATTLILLSKIKRLDLLDLFKPLWTTPSIKQEVLDAKNLPSSQKEILDAYFKTSIHLATPTNNRNFSIGDGEMSALNLCIEKQTKIFISDDKKARSTAELLAIRPLGTAGIVLANLQKGRITEDEAFSIIHLLLCHSYHLHSDVYSSVIEAIRNHHP